MIDMTHHQPEAVRSAHHLLRDRNVGDDCWNLIVGLMNDLLCPGLVIASSVIDAVRSSPHPTRIGWIGMLAMVIGEVTTDGNELWDL